MVMLSAGLTRLVAPVGKEVMSPRSKAGITYAVTLLY
jgi:hypothetical protein